MAFVQQIVGTGSTSGTKAFASSTTAGNLILVALCANSGGSFTVSDSQGNTYAQLLDTIDSYGFNQGIAVYYARNIVGGACTVTAAPPSGGNNVAWIQAEFSNAGLIDKSSTVASGSGTAVAANSITPTASEECVGVVFKTSAGNLTATGSWANALTNSTAGGSATRVAIESQVTGSAVATTGTITSGSWQAYTYGFAPTATGPTAVTLTDTGAGADALTVGAAIPLTGETGTGVDNLTVTVPVALADTGAGVDNFTVFFSIPLPDIGAGVDVLVVKAAVPLVETGTGVDTLIVGAGIPLAGDTGSGADALTVKAAVPLPEIGAGVDNLTVFRPVTLADTGAGVDALVAVTFFITTHVRAFATLASNGLSDSAVLAVAPAASTVAGNTPSLATVTFNGLSTAAVLAVAPSLSTLASSGLGDATLAFDGLSTAVLAVADGAATIN